MVKGAAIPGVYSATYSNIPVYEFQFHNELTHTLDHVMRRRSDDYINATHILKACNYDKPARTRILEREVQKDTHEKVQGGYGKYQGTWIPLAAGEALAVRNNVYDQLRPIFEFIPGDQSPPPAPKHTSNKPKVVKKPNVPKFNSMPPPRALSPDPQLYENMSQQPEDEETPDNTTVASASYFEDDDRDRFDMSAPSTAHRRRQYSEMPNPRNVQEQNHLAYADELLDYFLMEQAQEPCVRPEPPLNFLPEFPVDNEGNTSLHWACAMGDIEVMKELRRFGADVGARNGKGETPLMRTVVFTNCKDKDALPRVLQELFGTISYTDNSGQTALHHAAQMNISRSKHSCARYYLDVILNKMAEEMHQDEIQRILDMQDNYGNTACHIAAKFQARKCVRALIGRGCATDIHNAEGVTAEELIQELNSSRRERNLAASSSPFAPDSQHRMSFQEPLADTSRHTTSHHSEAAMTVEAKITPLIMEKFQHLAQSFDQELIDRDRSEKEAKRILQQTQIESAQIRERQAQLDAEEENEEERLAEEAELARLKTSVISLLEQQQKIRLGQMIQQTESMSNGVNGHGRHDDNVEAKAGLWQDLQNERGRRVALVEDYTEALGMAGMGEKGEQYRKLTAKVLGMDEEAVDTQLDSLLEVLEEGKNDEKGEAMVVD